MSPKKVWVIDAGGVGFGKSAGEADRVSARAGRPSRSDRSDLPRSAPAHQPGPGHTEARLPALGASQTAGRDPGIRSGASRHIALAYALGPLYLLLTRPSTGTGIWAVLGLAAAGAGAAAMAQRTELMLRAADADLGVVPLVAGIWLLTVLGSTAWALALVEAGRRVPEGGVGQRNSSFAAAGGFLLPGLSLLLAGCRHRAAMALWTVGPLAGALVTLGHGPWLWYLNAGMGERGIPGEFLEYVFLASLFVVLGGCFAWLVQALEGMRRGAPAGDRHAHGQPLALALIVVIGLFLATFRPAKTAETLDHFAVAMRLDGLRVIPLYLELGAVRLDPATPLFALRAAELYAELGWPDEARHLRDMLHGRWSSYSRAIERESSRPALQMPQMPQMPPVPAFEDGT